MHTAEPRRLHSESQQRKKSRVSKLSFRVLLAIFGVISFQFYLIFHETRVSLESSTRGSSDWSPLYQSLGEQRERHNRGVRRRLNATKKNRTKGLGNLLFDRSESQTRQLSKFNTRRSKPVPPADFDNVTIPTDPLSPAFNLSKLVPTNFTLRSKWHGVLLDAGRHYFEVDWIKRMLDVLSVLQYNCLHFRLTDDQAFNIRLDSHPELAHPVGLFGNNRTYTPAELRDIVAYGKTKGITIWPEINVPGHGGGWAGIPGLVVACPKFICDKGYGVPINVTHPQFRSILTDVLREVVDIFDNPPYLHLGGDEVDMSQPCFKEFGKPMFNYDVFESTLVNILKDIRFPEERVIRWEMTGQRLKAQRAGKIPQYWFRIPGENAPDWGHNGFFASGGLYFDFNEMDMGWQIYLFARRYYHLPRNNFPIGIIVGTFELDSNFWFDRNVVGRLLAVTMGASKEVNADDGQQFNKLYQTACRDVGFENALCSHYGLPMIPWNDYRDKWNDVWTQWKKRICTRLTTSDDTVTFVSPSRRHKRVSKSRVTGDEVVPVVKQDFWTLFDTSVNESTISLDTNPMLDAVRVAEGLEKIGQRLVPHIGIILDPTWGNEFDDLVDHSHPLLSLAPRLGFGLIQLRLATDYGFGFLSSSTPEWFDGTEQRPTIEMISRKFVTEATRLGIGVIPEISLATNAGGMYGMEFEVPCPQYTCEHGHGIQNIKDPTYVGVAYSLVREIQKLATTGLIHLGYDERQSAQECFAELSDNGLGPLDRFENKLAYLLAYNNITSDRIIRWSNQEKVVYPGRLGSITQCKSGDCENIPEGKWFATVDILQGGASDIFQAAKALSIRKPQAIFADVGKTGKTAIKEHNIAMRMLAFAMGTSNIESWDESTFVSLCSAMGSDLACQEFSTSRDGVEEDQTARTEVNRKQMCETRTATMSKYYFRPEFMDVGTTMEIKASY
eukprot:Nitzschia sp. Nitz4//scaffold31_size150131//47767//50844//NITZ4_002819-RA/size150131-processed-gene-0.223-mRNA-1//-1//CDS//3329547632//1358//frame0